MRTLNEAPVSYREAPVMMGPATGGLGEDAKKPSLKLTFSHLNSWMVGILSRLPFGVCFGLFSGANLLLVSGRHMTYATGEEWQDNMAFLFFTNIPAIRVSSTSYQPAKQDCHRQVLNTHTFMEFGN